MSIFRLKKSQKITAEDLHLTFPDTVKLYLESAYRGAETILEYGSGGSTMLAAKLGKRVYSVESDFAWATTLQNIINTHGYGDLAQIMHVNIGKTGQWGRPLDHAEFQRYHLYPTAIWDRPDFIHPDVILIDGRLRPACLLTAIAMIKKPTVVLFDDYVNRPHYHFVENVISPACTIDRLAVFNIEPGINLNHHLSYFAGSFALMATARNRAPTLPN